MSSKETTYVGIDASITSTAVCVEQDGTDRYLNYTTSEKHTGWMKLLEPVVTFHLVHYEHPKDYSDSEKYKLASYLNTATRIVSDIPDNSSVGMEAYSQSSDAGHLIDLVTLGTFIRSGVVASGWDLELYAPMTMKKQACIIAYNNPDKKGKIWRNNDGVAGGSFKKHEMLKAMLDATLGGKNALADILRDRATDILLLKAIPKPIDDLVDAWWAKEIAKKRFDAPGP